MRARSAVVGTLLVVLLLSALYPVRQYFTQKSTLAQLTAEEVRLSERVRALTELRERLLTNDEIERIAREELGMVRPGEIAFAVVPGADKTSEKGPPTAPAVDAEPPVQDRPAWHERWWEAVTDAVTGMR